MGRSSKLKLARIKVELEHVRSRRWYSALPRLLYLTRELLDLLRSTDKAAEKRGVRSPSITIISDQK